MNDKMKIVDKIGDDFLAATSDWNAICRNEATMEKHDEKCTVENCGTSANYRIAQICNIEGVIEKVDAIKAGFEKLLAMIEAENAGAKN